MELQYNYFDIKDETTKDIKDELLFDTSHFFNLVDDEKTCQILAGCSVLIEQWLNVPKLPSDPYR